MKCPSCNIEIGLFKNPIIRTKLSFKKAVSCPCCKVTIYSEENTAWEYYEPFIFILFLIGSLLFFMAVIFSRHVGFKSALYICFWFWIITIAVSLVILFLNLIFVLLNRLYAWIGKGKKDL